MLFAFLGFLVVAVLVVLAFVFWIMMLIDVVKNPKLDNTMRIIWFIVVFFGHWLGALIYFFVGRNAGVTVVKK